MTGFTQQIGGKVTRRESHHLLLAPVALRYLTFGSPKDVKEVAKHSPEHPAASSGQASRELGSLGRCKLGQGFSQHTHVLPTDGEEPEHYHAGAHHVGVGVLKVEQKTTARQGHRSCCVSTFPLKASVKPTG